MVWNVQKLMNLQITQVLRICKWVGKSHNCQPLDSKHTKQRRWRNGIGTWFWLLSTLYESSLWFDLPYRRTWRGLFWSSRCSTSWTFEVSTSVSGVFSTPLPARELLPLFDCFNRLASSRNCLVKSCDKFFTKLSKILFSRVKSSSRIESLRSFFCFGCNSIASAEFSRTTGLKKMIKMLLRNLLVSDSPEHNKVAQKDAFITSLK